MDFHPFDNVNITLIFRKVKHFLHPGSTFSPQTSSQNITKCYKIPAPFARKASPPAPFRARVLGGIANFRNVKRKPEPSQFPKQEFQPVPPPTPSQSPAPVKGTSLPLSNKVHFLPGHPLTAPAPRPIMEENGPSREARTSRKSINPSLKGNPNV